MIYNRRFSPAAAAFIAIGVIAVPHPVGSATEAAKPEAAKPESTVPPKTRMALKLAGLVTFVADSCPDLQPDYGRFKQAISALGVSTADLERVDLKGIYLSYTLRYKVDRDASCARALKDFGPSGGVIADLVKPKNSR